MISSLHLHYPFLHPGARRPHSVPGHSIRSFSTSSSSIGSSTSTSSCYSGQTIENLVAEKELFEHYCHHSSPLTLGNFMDLGGFQNGATRGRRKTQSETKERSKSRTKKKVVEIVQDSYSVPSISSVTPSPPSTSSSAANSTNSYSSRRSSLLEEPAMPASAGLPNHHPVNGDDPPSSPPLPSRSRPTTTLVIPIIRAALSWISDP